MVGMMTVSDSRVLESFSTVSIHCHARDAYIERPLCLHSFPSQVRLVNAAHEAGTDADRQKSVEARCNRRFDKDDGSAEKYGVPTRLWESRRPVTARFCYLPGSANPVVSFTNYSPKPVSLKLFAQEFPALSLATLFSVSSCFKLQALTRFSDHTFSTSA